MTQQKWRKVMALSVAVVLLAVLLYPPFEVALASSPVAMGFAPIWAHEVRGYAGVRVNVELLLIEIFVVLAIGAGIYAAFKPSRIDVSEQRPPAAKPASNATDEAGEVTDSRPAVFPTAASAQPEARNQILGAVLAALAVGIGVKACFYFNQPTVEEALQRLDQQHASAAREGEDKTTCLVMATYARVGGNKAAWRSEMQKLAGGAGDVCRHEQKLPHDDATIAEMVAIAQGVLKPFDFSEPDPPSK